MLADVEQVEGFLDADDAPLGRFAEAAVEQRGLRLDQLVRRQLLRIGAADDDAFHISHVR
ncbi:hypothetical protein D3C78_1963420 [compost metagenome]